MKKTLTELNTHEFVSILLHYNPKQAITISFDDADNGDTFIGTYDEILELSLDRLNYPGNVLAGMMDSIFDYNMNLDQTDTVEYLHYRTKGFDPDLTAAFLNDMKLEVRDIFHTIMNDLGSQEEFEKWKEASTSELNTALDILERKCKGFAGKTPPPQKTILSPDCANMTDADNSISGPAVLSDRMEELMGKASNLFKDGNWHNDNKKEYAVFLRCLYCKATYQSWDEVKYVKWTSLPIKPMANGNLPTISQLKDSMKNYSDVADGGKRRQYEILLNQ